MISLTQPPRHSDHILRHLAWHLFDVVVVVRLEFFHLFDVVVVVVRPKFF